MSAKDLQLVAKPPQDLQHGLSRDRQHADKCGVALRLQFNPVTPAQQILVEELVRRAVQMREFEDVRGVLRDRAEAALSGVLGAGDNTNANLGVGGAVAVASGQHEAVVRQGLAAARGFFRSLDALQNSKALATPTNGTTYIVPTHASTPSRPAVRISFAATWTDTYSVVAAA
jgi:hypothetical protein